MMKISPKHCKILSTCDLGTKIYTPWPANLAALEANLRREVANLDPAMIRRAILDMRSRAHKCIANNGGHVEN